MMSNSKKIIKIDLTEFYRVSTLTKQDIFYKNGKLKNSGFKAIYDFITSAARQLTEIKEEYSYDRDTSFIKLEICSIRGDIRIIYDWDKLEFDKYSPYYNVYDFENHYTKVLSEITQYMLQRYGIIALIY